MSLSDLVRRRLRAAADAFLDPTLVEPDNLGWEPPDQTSPVVGAEGASSVPVPPEPREGMRNLVVVILDSCRYDTFVRAKPKWISKLGAIEKRFSYASWTGPSHYNLLTGLFPHASPKHVFASEYYKEDFARFSERLGIFNIKLNIHGDSN